MSDESNTPDAEVQVERDGYVACVTINRPSVMNALSTSTLDELEKVIDSLGGDEEIRAVIITGGGEKAFVAGADITEIRELDRASGEAFARRGQDLFRKIEMMPKVVIAAVNGFALGGGCELAMACDIRVASENAKFGQPEINLGIIPGYGGTQRFTRLIGYGKAAELLMTGAMISAEQAKEMKLVERIVPEGSAAQEATDLARTIAGKAPLAIAAIKRAMDASQGDHAEGYQNEAMEFGAIMESEDKAEGLEAFIEKRTADWKGR
ncbi:enoyl-CoA hydratase/isomerase family protein [Candidatus Zixiibacteriota bacterium]